MIELSEHPAGVIVPVRAQPGASRAGIRGAHAGALKVSVTQAAEKGKANEALAETLAKALGLSRSQVELLRGATQREKRFLVRGVTCEELAARIAAALQT